MRDEFPDSDDERDAEEERRRIAEEKLQESLRASKARRIEIFEDSEQEDSEVNSEAAGKTFVR